MSAVEKFEQDRQYIILYFDGSKMAQFEVNASNREEAIEAFKAQGISVKDIFSITPWAPIGYISKRKEAPDIGASFTALNIQSLRIL